MWYERGAAQGDPAAQYGLGLMYDKGKGLLPDAVLAHKWLERKTDVLLGKGCLRALRAAQIVELILVDARVETFLVRKHMQQSRQPPR
jgi:hypothetical protein